MEWLDTIKDKLVRFLGIAIAKINNWGRPKIWTSEVKDQENISGFTYMILKWKNYVFKKSIFKKLSIVLYTVHS